MFIKLKELWKFPKGSKIQFQNAKIDYPLYYIKSHEEIGQIFWDGKKFIYLDDLFDDIENIDDIELFVYQYTEENLIQIYNALIAELVSFCIEEPFIMEKEIEVLKESIKHIKEVINEKKDNKWK